MGNLIEKFGAYVGNQIESRPERARRLLLAGYRAKLLQLSALPDKRLMKARDLLAVESMKAVIAPLAHPDRSALVSVFMPCELLQVAGIHPMFAEAMASYITGADAERAFVDYAEKSGIPETFCSYHKILLGGILSDVVPKPKFVVNTSLVCDANNLTFRMAAEHCDIPHHFIDVPMDPSEESVQYVAAQLREFAGFLSDFTRRAIDEEALKERIACGARTMEKLAKCQELKREKYLSNDLTDEMYEIFGALVMMGEPAVERYADMLQKELLQAEKDRGIRLLWMHTIPYYQQDLRALLNFSKRVQIVACDMNFSGYIEMDPAKPYESMARRMVYNSFNGPSTRRLAKSLEMCDALDVDGVVYFCHWGCKQTLGAAGNAKQMLEAAGYPVLVLDGDGCDRRNMSDGQLMTRMEAFLEMLEARRGYRGDGIL